MTSELRSFIGMQIRLARVSFCWTQAELAGSLGCRQATVSDWETGKCEPRFSMLLDMCVVFNKSISYFVPSGDLSQSRIYPGDIERG